MTNETIRQWIQECARLMRDRQAYLTQLDAAIGDADHGSNMTRGFDAAEAKLAEMPADTAPGALLVMVGQTLVSSIGGASGPIWGSVFRRAGKTLGEGSDISHALFVEALDKGLVAVMELGAAEPGDKTMVDALSPAVDALKGALGQGVSLEQAVTDATEAANRGALETVPMVARKGRASYLGERSVGHQDPGATSTALIVAALERAVKGG
jgi:phosphoenolpyruvate---glycerone phosphotransferase subunit DhaL